MQFSYEISEQLPFNDPEAEVLNTIQTAIPQLTNVTKDLTSDPQTVTFDFSSAITEQDLLNELLQYRTHPDSKHRFSITAYFSDGYDFVGLRDYLNSDSFPGAKFTLINDKFIEIRFPQFYTFENIKSSVLGYAPSGKSRYVKTIQPTFPSGFYYPGLKTHLEQTLPSVDLIWDSDSIVFEFTSTATLTDLNSAITSYSPDAFNTENSLNYGFKAFVNTNNPILLDRLSKYISGYTQMYMHNNKKIYFKWAEAPDQSVQDHLIEEYQNLQKFPVNIYRNIDNSYYVDSNDRKLLTKQKTEYIVSQDGQYDYSTIAAAIAAIPAGQMSIIKVYPGTYAESNPLTLPQGCVLESAGSAINTKIVAADSNANLINLGAWCEVNGFTLIGAAKGVSFDCSTATSYSIVSECIIVDCTIGAYAHNGTVGSLLVNRTSTSLTQSIPTAMALHSDGGSIIATAFIVSGTPTYMFNKGVCSSGGGRVTVTTFSTYYATTAVEVNDNGSELRGSQMYLIACGTALKFGSTPTARMVIGVVNIENCTTDIDIQATEANVELLSAHLDANKITNPNSVTISGLLVNKDTAYKLQVLTGDVSIGSTASPTNLVMGKGYHPTANLKVFRYINATSSFSDISATMQVKSDASVLAMAQNDYLYVSCSSAIDGFVIHVTSADSINRGDLKVAYYNGSTWKNSGFMTTKTSTNRRNRNVIFDNSEPYNMYVRHKNRNASTTINGVDAYWLRLEMIAAKTIEVSYMELHSDSVCVNNNGLLTNRSDARVLKSSDLTGCIIDGTGNAKTMYMILPPDIDTSSEVKFVFLFTASASLTFEGTNYAGQYIEVIYEFADTFADEYITFSMETADTFAAIKMDYYAWY